MSPQPQFELASMAYCSLLCHNDPSIILRESMHKHNFGQILKLQCCGYHEYKVKVIKIKLTLFLSPIKFGADKPTGPEDRVQKMLNLQFFKDDDLEMR